MGTQTNRGITTPKGFRAAAGCCGIKPSGKPDLALIVADRLCSVAGVFTTNKFPSPSVAVGRRHVRAGTAQGIVCNSGVSNAATGKQGGEDALAMCRLVSRHVPWMSGGWFRRIVPCSTGVIGEYLPMEKISDGIGDLGTRLSRGNEVNEAVATAIMTTDLASKQGYRSLRIGRSPGKLVHVAGIAKGSGMIAPNMATMLAFITTDVAITPRMLKVALKRAVGESFNRISVDQHTSPSDTVLVLASGMAKNREIDGLGENFERFREVLTDLCQDLAYQIVCDGEGATRVFRVRVIGAKSQRDADSVGGAITDSPLVKTAVHGADPNWGRIITAAGYSAATIHPDKTSLYIASPRSKKSQQEASSSVNKPTPEGVCVFDHGHPAKIDARSEKRLAKIMEGKEIVFTLDLGVGQAETEWLGCDLSKDYVTINADYTT